MIVDDIKTNFLNLTKRPLDQEIDYVNELSEGENLRTVDINLYVPRNQSTRELDKINDLRQKVISVSLGGNENSIAMLCYQEEVKHTLKPYGLGSVKITLKER